MSYEVLESTEIRTRRQFADLCRARRLLRAVEVGTDRGAFARELLSGWDALSLWCVDLYDPYPTMPWDRDADRLLAIAHLAEYAERVRFLRMSSTEAAKVLVEEEHIVEFVYVDASHEYEDVREDLEAWWKVVYPETGILAGHDFDEEHDGVRQAVKEFAEEKDATVRLTRDGDSPPSWYIYKAEPEVLVRFEA